MDNAVILGYGMVGKAMAHAFGIKKFFDIKGDISNITLKEVAETTRYVFVCLPTPVTNSRYVTEPIFDIIKQITSYGGQNVFIIKSTVYPGFADSVMNRLNINCVVSCPEFLSEDTWQKDVENPEFIVVGGRKKNYIDDVVGIHRARYKGVDIITCENVTAELAKWSINGFGATKLVYVNQVADFARTVKANYQTIKEIMSKCKFVGRYHLEVEHKGGRGAGGKCLKKDLEAFSELSNLPLLRVVNGINKSYLESSGKD